jgi:hypothetical protein
VDVDHLLFDDRAFVQILGYIVGGGPDQLDPASERLVVRGRCRAAADKLGDRVKVLIARGLSALDDIHGQFDEVER